MTSPTDWHLYKPVSLNPEKAISETASHSAGASLRNSELACNEGFALFPSLHPLRPPGARSKKDPAILQFMLDALALLSAALLVSVTGIGIAFALFVLLFVKT